MNKRNPSGAVTLQEAETEKAGHFKYLGSTVKRNRKFGKELMKHVQAGWRKVSVVMCDRL